MATSSPTRRVVPAPPAPRGEVSLLAERAGMALGRTLRLSLALAWVLTSTCWFTSGEEEDKTGQIESFFFFFLGRTLVLCLKPHLLAPSERPLDLLCFRPCFLRCRCYRSRGVRENETDEMRWNDGKTRMRNAMILAMFLLRFLSSPSLFSFSHLHLVPPCPPFLPRSTMSSPETSSSLWINLPIATLAPLRTSPRRGPDLRARTVGEPSSVLAAAAALVR